MEIVKINEIQLYTTPKELREIADKMEEEYPKLRIGDSKKISVVTAKGSDVIWICADQDKIGDPIK